MFKRRKQHSVLDKLRELFWPRMGWKRAAVYAKHRLTRMSAPTHNITAGLVIGMCVSSTPFFGFHFFLALGWARILKANYLASIIGTFFGNPWTFPFLMWLSFETGVFVLKLFGYDGLVEQSNPADMEEVRGSIFEFMARNFWELYFPTVIGGFICMIALWPVYYGPVYYIVLSAQRARRRRLVRKWRKRKAKAEQKAHEAREARRHERDHHH